MFMTGRERCFCTKICCCYDKYLLNPRMTSVILCFLNRHGFRQGVDHAVRDNSGTRQAQSRSPPASRRLHPITGNGSLGDFIGTV